MGFSELNFNCVKGTDQNYAEAFDKIAEECNLKVVQSNFNLAVGGLPIGDIKDSFATSKVLSSILEFGGENISKINVTLSDQSNAYQFNAEVQRKQDQSHDAVKLKLNSINDKYLNSALQIASSFRKYFKALDSKEKAISVLDSNLQEHYKHRETELARLEGICQSLIRDQEKHRRSLEDQYKQRKKTLDEVNEKEKKRLKVEEEKLNLRLKEIDDRQSKHARRELRKGLKDEFKSRSQKFQLSEGTQKLRNPIQSFTIILLMCFGSGLFSCFIVEIVSIVDSKINLTLQFYLMQVAFGAAFASTSLFYIRWNNRWFERHANEEFTLKRQEIDIDRGSWIAELAAEWLEERDRELPESLVTSLSKNLFTDEKVKEPQLHPVDQLASAILGTSARANLKLPTGTEIELDRKSLSDLNKNRTDR